VDFHLLSNLVGIELDRAIGWVKVTRTTGEVFLIQPRDMLTLMTWSQENAPTLVATQQTIDQEVSHYISYVQEQARPIRLIDPLPAEPTSPQTLSSPKRKRRKLLPIPSIQMSQAFPCLLRCKTMTRTALLDFGAGPADPWLLYPFCEDHLRAVQAEREATGLSLRVIVQHQTQTPPP
jgi:hypothetical protein